MFKFFLCILSNNNGSFLKFVNRRISNQVDIGLIITPDNTTLTTDYEKACSFNDYFTSVGRPDTGTIPSCSSRTDICLDTIEVNAANLMAAIKKLKSNHSCGTYGLPPVLFKHLQHIIANPLAIIFKQLLSVSYVPEC